MNEEMTTSNLKLATMMTMEPLVTQTLAVMVLRTYADRVRDKLLGLESEWVSLPITDEPSTRKRSLPPSCTTIPTPHVRGGRKNRRGFTLLVLEGVTSSLVDLSPIVRQNISHAMELTHRLPASEEGVGSILWSLFAEKEFDTSKHVLRVYCFPKEETEKICLGLQRAAASNNDEEVQPFDGAIPMTMSASKCTHTLHVIRDEDSYWVGLVPADPMVAKLNNNAAKQVIIEPTDPNTGEDLSPTAKLEAPVSRAYYKLDQVWREILAPVFVSTTTRGAAVDLGAAPGGWTQVLRYHFPRVVAVDQGVLARRVAAMEGIQELVAELSSEQVAQALAATAPLSMLVCDSSTDSNEILAKIESLLKRLGKGCWTLPCAWVVTLKLPYKTVGSMERNLGLVLKTVPQHLESAAALAFDQPVSIKFKVIHLLANSESERTIVAVFDRKSL
jgi:hypothetical protein